MNCANNSMSLLSYPILLSYTSILYILNKIKYDFLTNYLIENKIKTVHLGVNRNITIKLVTKLTNWSINYKYWNELYF